MTTEDRQLYGFQFVDSEGRLQRPSWAHYTEEQTFQVFATMVLGGPEYAFCHQGRCLGVDALPETCLANMRKGDYDGSAGSKISEAKIPDDVRKWNGLTADPYYVIKY